MMEGNRKQAEMQHPAIDLLQQAVAHLEHVLPGQGPILDFVHHNTIHGFQHLPFFDALDSYEKLTGVHGYQPAAVSRSHYRRQRITDADLCWAMAHLQLPQVDSVLAATGDQVILGRDVYHACLLHDLLAFPGRSLQWHLGAGTALTKLQADVPAAARQRLMQGGLPEGEILRPLWSTLQDLQHSGQNGAVNPDVADASAGIAAEEDMALLFGNGESPATLREIFLKLSGVDVLDKVRPLLIRFASGVLDEGMALWHATDEELPDLYGAWREAMRHDLGALLEGLPGAHAVVAQLPASPWEAMAGQLAWCGIPQEHWAAYLERLALELPGWAGLINWRQRRPGYQTVNPARPALEDFLAIRLVYDRLFLGSISRQWWHCEPDINSLRHYFDRNPDELAVRLRVFGGGLPEQLTRRAQALMIQSDTRLPEHREWQVLGEDICQWEQVHAQDREQQQRTWQWFVLCQHLGLDADDARAVGREALLKLEDLASSFTRELQGRVWLLAFERHYHDTIFNALRCNRNRGGWLDTGARPSAQIVMCMDEREESFRRHLEEIDPTVETLGAAGFFGIPMRYRGLDAHHETPLCPVVVTPVNRVHEAAVEGHEVQLKAHESGRETLEKILYLLHQKLRHVPIMPMLLALLAFPVLLVDLLLSALQQGRWVRLIDRARTRLVPPVITRLHYTATETAADGLRHGFTDTEQADRVAGMLRTLGLTGNFAPIVALAGHGSTSQNNPHEAAHDCGACGGRQGGPNARVFAAMANRAEVRKLLADRGIEIPADTWFVGMQHDTCSDLISWYDTDLVPESLKPAFQGFRHNIEQAQQRSAHERCRRFMSAIDARTPALAFEHVTRRARDLTQVRPEYGHATNAAAVIGRRQLTRGVFFDRRLFLISYDPEQDAHGRILENILLTAGPVGAGINLEYYFSTIDNNRFGCGTKIPHNVTGLCAVMEGAGSDLRTGLPLQMVEIHEAMRLQVIVEASTAVLTRIYTDNPPLQELVGGGWLLLSAVDPVTGVISVFRPGEGFVTWQGDSTLPESGSSMDCYDGIDTPIDPVLIRVPGREAA